MNILSYALITVKENTLHTDTYFKRNYNKFKRLSSNLFINYNTIRNYIQIIFDHMLGVISQIRVSGGNRTHDLQANSLAHYPLDFKSKNFF